MDHIKWGSERRAKANLWVKHRNRTMTAPKPGFTLGSGNSMEGTYLLARRCPVQSRRDSDPGFGAELENPVGSVKGKRHKRQNLNGWHEPCESRGSSTDL